MRAKSRAEARAKGEGDVRADDKYEEYAYSVCAPGTERTGTHFHTYFLRHLIHKLINDGVLILCFCFPCFDRSLDEGRA